jgi:Tol biopolymer transport system component
MGRVRIAAIAGVLVVAAACTGAPDGPSGAIPTLEPLPNADAGNRLLVQMDDGSIVTVAPDGDAPVILAPSRGDDVEVRQPAWSPDGRSVAWAEIELGDDGQESRVVTSRADGSLRTELPVQTGTFFLQWDPTSSRIAYLGSFRGAIGMGVAETDGEGGPAAKLLGAGQPFFLSWSPHGDRLLIHVGDSTLATLDLEGEPTQLADDPGLFQAPVWLADGRFVYAAVDHGRQRLIVAHGGHEELVRFRGVIEFVVSPTGDRVAYRIDDGDGLGGVSVVDIASGRRHVATDASTSAFEWTPDGRRLLLMTIEPGSRDPIHRWRVWDGRETRTIGPTFQPSPTFLRDYVPFFGQYAQGMSLWSPDGRSFAFPGLIGDRAGIWVQDLDADEPSFVLEDGAVVSWSPVA